ncbi:MAG: signal peptidase I [Pseudonocardiales bacterium]|nr:signal peptidase I [Pseudonocardiales bacterium]
MKVLRLATTLLTTAVLVVGLGLVALLVVVPRVTGTVPLTVYTGSMEPTIATGAVVLIEPVDPATLQVGDVITYQVAPDVDEYITHRIVALQPDTTPPSFVTKGDNNPGEDIDPVPVGAVRGKVWIDVPFVGTAQQFVTGRTGIATIAVFGGLVLLGSVVVRLLRREPDEPPARARPADVDAVTAELPRVGPRA